MSNSSDVINEIEEAMRPLRFERQQRTPTSTSTPTRASNASLDSIALGGGEPSTSRSGGSTPGLSDYFGAPQDNSAAFDDISGASTCLGGEAESAESRLDAPPPPPSSRYPIQRPASRLQREVQRGDDEQLGHRSPVDVAPPQVPPSRRQQPIIPLQQQQQQPIPLQQQPNPQQQQQQPNPQQQQPNLQQQPNPQQQQQQQQQPIPLQQQPNPQLLQQQQPIPLQQQQQPIPLQQQPSLQLESLPSAQQAISQTQDISRVANTQQPVLPKQQHYLATRAPESSLGSVSGTDAPVAVDCSVTPLPLSGDKYSAWLPSKHTKLLLDNQTATVLTQLLLTSDFSKFDTLPLSPVQLKLSQKGITEMKRPICSLKDLKHDIPTLCQLIEDKDYFLAILLTSILLSHQGITDYNLQIWYTRFFLMVQTEQYDSLDKEIAPFRELDNPDMYYEFYPELKIAGSMVSFSFRLLHAYVPQSRKNFDLSLDRIYKLKQTIDKMIAYLDNGLTEYGNVRDGRIDQAEFKSSRNILEMRMMKVLYMAASCTLQMKDYMNCLNILGELVTLDRSNAFSLQSAIGRVYLQIGNIEKSRSIFRMLTENSIYKCREYESKQHMNCGLLAIADNNMKLAKEHFSAIKDDIAAANNYAVCRLYTGDLTGALATLTSTFNPASTQQKTIHEPIAFNLSTLYELETNSSESAKLALLKLVGDRETSSFNVACVKL